MVHARWIILTRAKRKIGFTFEPSRYRLNSINGRTNNSEIESSSIISGGYIYILLYTENDRLSVIVEK